MGAASENVPKQLFPSKRNAISNWPYWYAHHPASRADKHPADASGPGTNSVNLTAADNAAATNSTTAI